MTALIAAVVAAGCVSSTEGSPLPSPGGAENEPSASAPSSSGDQLPYAGAPAVADPLDTELFQRDPCQALASDQAGTLELRYPGTLRDSSLGKACEFRVRADRLALVEIASLDRNPYGVSAIYQAEKDGKLAFFEPLEPIGGYPAVAYGALDERDAGACSVVIGTSDEIAFEVALQQSAGNVGKKDPCETGSMVAEMVLETMKAAQ
ncbi:DUF3558 domain-containing protein [Actinophytocola glycyrrhizae]|uniref:DUF3558 domain-containing protein n=1 Tax=Actinophytocola glycyrrhizae TaxID=2044873 RepID=A0ABV9SFQ8_9PSEU